MWQPQFENSALRRSIFLLILSFLGALSGEQDTGSFYAQVIPKHKGMSQLESHDWDYFPLLGFAG